VIDVPTDYSLNHRHLDVELPQAIEKL
jgi:hypothetical protein